MTGPRYEIAIDGTTRTIGIERTCARSCDLPQEILPPPSRNLADRRFAAVAEVAEGRLGAGHLCDAPACVCTLLLQVASARLCGGGGRCNQILTRCGELIQMLLDAACDPTLTRLDVCTMLFDVTHARSCTILRYGACSSARCRWSSTVHICSVFQL
jgi:hypothetical protein